MTNAVRSKNLVASGSISQAQSDADETQLEVNTADLNALQGQIEPKIVLPMHYWGRYQLDRFMGLLAPLEPEFVWPDTPTIEVAKQSLPDKLTVIAVGGEGGG